MKLRLCFVSPNQVQGKCLSEIPVGAARTAGWPASSLCKRLNRIKAPTYQSKNIDIGSDEKLDLLLPGLTLLNYSIDKLSSQSFLQYYQQIGILSILLVLY